LELLDELEIKGIENLAVGQNYTVLNKTKNLEFVVKHDLSEDQIEVIKNGGLLNTIKKSNK